MEYLKFVGASVPCRPASGKMKSNMEITGYEEPLERIGVYIKYVVLSLIVCVLIIGSCILASVDLQPKAVNGMPLIAVEGSCSPSRRQSTASVS